MNTHTSLKLSQWLQERGFEGESEMYWTGHGYYRTEIFEHTWHLTKEDKNGEKDRATTGDYGAEADLVLVSIPAYDLLWDLCVKYAVEVFGEDGYYSDGKFTGIITMKEASAKVKEYPCGLYHHGYTEDTLEMFKLIQQNKKEEAEDYFMKHSIL